MTSIECVFEQLEEQGLVYKNLNNELSISISASDYLDIKRLVKQMHKQEIMNTYIIADSESTQEDSEHYALKFYERTYGKGSETNSGKPNLSEKPTSSVTEDTSDGYHTFKELYEFRKVYNAALFNEWAKLYSDYDVHKSWKHNDGELCFGGGWFIVVAILPDGQISNHYKAEDWDLFKIPEVEKAKYEFDGHTSADTIKRINGIYTKKN